MVSYGYIRFRSIEHKNSQFEFYKNELLEMEISEQNIIWEIRDYSEKLPKFEELLKCILKSGDILYIPKLYQVGKSFINFLKLQRYLKNKNILFIILEFPSAKDLKFQRRFQEVLYYIAEKEAEQRIRRQKRGIDLAREKGIIGRKTKLTDKQVRMIHKLKKNDMPVKEISIIAECSMATIYRVLRHQFQYPS